MKTATLAETQDHLSDLIEEVKSGETVLIVEQGSPVARLVPPGEAASRDDEEILARLERKGVIRRGLGGVVREILDTPPPRPREGASALRELLEEREEGR